MRILENPVGRIVSGHEPYTEVGLLKRTSTLTGRNRILRGGVEGCANSRRLHFVVFRQRMSVWVYFPKIPRSVYM